MNSVCIGPDALNDEVQIPDTYLLPPANTPVFLILSFPTQKQ